MAWQGPNTSIKMRGRSRDIERERQEEKEEVRKKTERNARQVWLGVLIVVQVHVIALWALDELNGWLAHWLTACAVLCCAWWHVPRATWRLVNYAKLAAALHKLIVECFLRIPLWVQLLIVARRKSEEIRYFCLFWSILLAGVVKCNVSLIRCILSRANY